MLEFSITADAILPFRLDVLSDDYHIWVGPSLLGYDVGAPQGPYRDNVVDISHLAGDSEYPQVFSVAIAAIVAVSLYKNRDAVLDSGLFGLLGDASVQMIDVDATAQIRNYKEFFYNHGVEKEKEPVVKLFNIFKTDLFYDAVKK